jgi:hypothetical protein
MAELRREVGTATWKECQVLLEGLHLANLKNCRLPEMGLVTVFCSLMMAGAGETAVQVEAPRFVVDCKMNPVKLVNHIKTAFEPEVVRIIHGRSVTVRVAGALLTVPAELVTTTLY